MQVLRGQPRKISGLGDLPDDDLVRRLRLAKRNDLNDLLGDLKLAAEKYERHTDEQLVGLISAELRSAAGNSVLNLGRGAHEFPYKQMVIDVADKLHPSKIRWTAFKCAGPESVKEIEDYVYARIQERISKWLHGMSDKRREALATRLEQEMQKKGYPEEIISSVLAGLAAGTLSGVALAGFVAPVLLGTLWTSLFGLSLAKLMIGGAAVGGPIGLTVGAGALVTSPSYSKTIPAIYRLIQIRVSSEEKAKLDD